MRSGKGGRHRGDPLAASWQPRPEEDTAGDGSRRRGGSRRARRGWSRYGWGVYAIPVLLVLTVFAVLRVPGDDSDQDRRAESAGSSSSDDKAAVVTEGNKSREYPDDIHSAKLPPGAPVPKQGSGTFRVVPGSTGPAGSGELYRYAVEIEQGVRLTEGSDSFGRLVQQTMSDPRGWTNPSGGDISVQRVGPDGPEPDFRVTLVSRNTAREVCGYGNGLPYDSSCHIEGRAYISAARWVRGAIAFDGDIGSYRRYVINHEVGHFFGNGHVPCGAQGELAPVMMQQTFSVSNDVLHRLNERVSQGTEIPANGFVCKPNAWPFPLGNNSN
ncbi:Protein of unknown function [Actinopolyspora lacussalsi subsp. righensis]|uniref:DUF3152 domain-containing protein n=1 Tax=Actinopolyspora righensis TaxID=995060 RepID=A0A1I7AIG1_9ACTN|nr:DUF3152 domain-containing protein [Actinopolyspora righensis]SFT74693.1 Protein of unknown function [Actinopolyspora righensis]